MFTNPAQILLAYGLQTSFIYPSTGPALGRSGFACDWRNPTNKGKRRIDFSVRYCCGKLIKITESMLWWFYLNITICFILFYLSLIVKPTRPPPTTTSTSKPTSSLVTHCTSKRIISLVYIFIVH